MKQKQHQTTRPPATAVVLHGHRINNENDHDSKSVPAPALTQRTVADTKETLTQRRAEMKQKTDGSTDFAQRSVSSADGSIGDGCTDGEDQDEELMSGACSTSSSDSERGDGEGEGESTEGGCLTSAEDAVDHLFADLMTEDIHEGGSGAVDASGIGIGADEELLMFYSGGNGGATFVSPPSAVIAL